MFKKCVHDWEKQSDIVMKSAFQQAVEQGFTIESSNSNVITQCHVVILTCKLCGNVRKEVTYNPLS